MHGQYDLLHMHTDMLVHLCQSIIIGNEEALKKLEMNKIDNTTHHFKGTSEGKNYELLSNCLTHLCQSQDSGLQMPFDRSSLLLSLRMVDHNSPIQ